MAILGQSTDTFNMFDQNIEKEFTTIYPTDIYLKGRIRFFESVLKRENIFFTDYFKDKYENQARQNIESKKSELEQQLVS
jgi:predicted metal-dependent HD superfamily phosphohydrolase